MLAMIPVSAQQTPPNVSMTFRVKVPANTPAGDKISMWSGIVYFANVVHTQFTLVAGTTDTWQATVSAPEGTIFRYSYIRNDSFGVREAYVPFALQTGNKPGVASREVVVIAGATISEAVALWTDTALLEHATGTIAGRVTDEQGKPLVGIFVAAGPRRKETGVDGTYSIDGVPAGQGVITFRTDDGQYRATTTAVNIPADGTASKDIALQTAAMSTVTFNVTVPADTPALGVPRLYGDAYNLGMVGSELELFADSTRLIDMTPLGGNRWTYTAKIGAGHCAMYLYTLGSYGRNNERAGSSGTAITRPLCVSGNITLNDTVGAWRPSFQVPVTLNVVSPTPGEVLYVTTDDSAGFQPLKMWVTSPTTATFVIYANSNSTLKYHYQRGVTAYVPEIIGQDSTTATYRSITTSAGAITQNDTVQEWRHEYREPALTTVTTGINRAVALRPATAPFQTGIFPVDVPVSPFLPLMQPTMARIKSKNAQWVKFGTYRLMRQDGELERKVADPDQDLIASIGIAKAQGLHVCLLVFVAPGSSTGLHTVQFIDRYYASKQQYFLYYARLAQQEGVEMLELANDWWPDETPTMKSYVNGKWKNILAAIRASGFTGKLTIDKLFAQSNFYDWYAGLDYLGDALFNPLGTTGKETVEELYDAVVKQLDTLRPISIRFNKPFFINSILYDSTDQSALHTYNKDTDLSPTNPTNPAIQSSYDTQARVFQAVLLALAETPWIQGTFDFGYAYTVLDSKGDSIRGKTAEEVTSQIYQQINARVSSSVPATCTVGAPTISDVHSLSEWGNFTTFASGSYLEIKGTNLGQTTRLWSGGDFQDAAAPVSLDSTMVSINGRRAFTYYNSPTQLNVQAPADSATGNVDITVTNCAGTSAPYTFQKAAIAPGLLAPPSFKIGGKQYLVALYNDGKTYVGRTNLIAGVPFREAKPGDRITAYGVGFGDTVPAVAPGTVAGVQNSVPNLSISFGTTPATVSYKGLAPGNVGLYQFDFIVPDVPDGDTEVVVKVGSAQVQQTVFLTVKR